MLITNHVLGGALVGALSPGPASAFGVGVVSHFAMDVAPHWGVPEYDRFLRVAVVDGLVGLTTMACIARWAPPGRRAAVLAGMLGACLPDADKPSALFFGRSPFPGSVDRFHLRIQHEAAHRMPHEVAAAAVQLLALRRLVSGARSARGRRRAWARAAAVG